MRVIGIAEANGLGGRAEESFVGERDAMGIST